MSSAAARNFKIAASPLVNRPRPCASRFGALRAEVPATAAPAVSAPFRKTRRFFPFVVGLFCFIISWRISQTFVVVFSIGGHTGESVHFV